MVALAAPCSAAAALAPFNGSWTRRVRPRSRGTRPHARRAAAASLRSSERRRRSKSLRQAEPRPWLRRAPFRVPALAGARRHWPIPVNPRNAGCDIGPLMVGAAEGAESGAGIRLCTAGPCGALGKRAVGLRTKPPVPRAKPPPWPNPPPRAKLGVAATRQVIANTAARRRRCMVVFLVLFRSPVTLRCSHRYNEPLHRYCVDFGGLAVDTPIGCRRRQALANDPVRAGR
jgi:hypothetical protein